MVDLKKRLLEIAYKHKLSHLGSYFSSLGIIDEIFSKKKEDDIFILSSGHCALALYVVLEKYHGHDSNIEVYVNINGYAAYDKIDTAYISDRLKAFLPRINLRYTSVQEFPFLKGINAHYHVMKSEDFKQAMEILDEA